MLKKRNLIFICLLILGVFLITSCLPKPPITESILKGQVIVPEGSIQAKQLTGQALADATVNIIDPVTGNIIATATTDASGNYQVFVPAGGPYLLQVVKDGVVVLQITPQVEVGIEYDLGTADCSTTAVALIALAMMDAGANLADIDLADIAADSNFDDVVSSVTSIIEAGGDPTESAAIEQAVEDFLSPPAPPPPPASTPTYTVTFDKNDAEAAGTMAAQTIASGSSANLTACAFTKTGWTFAGWAETSGGAVEYADGESYTMGSANVTLYAKWTINTYTVTFNSQGGSTVDPQTVNHGGKATEPTAPTKTGHTFGDWYKESGCTNVWDFTTDTVTVDVTLYAQWTINSYTVTYNGNGNTGGTVPAGPTSYTYGATVTVFGNTGNLVKIQDGISLLFNGWNTQAGGSGTSYNKDDTFNMGSTNVTLYAQWSVLRGTGPAGGLIFYDKGSVSDGWRYLEAAPVNQTSRYWGTNPLAVPGADGTAIGTGKQNTLDIIAGDTLADKAADECANYSITIGVVTYDDWFLPSKDELNQMYTNLYIEGVGGFIDGDHWSSSEYNSERAWLQGFYNGGQVNSIKDFWANRVRAVRAFRSTAPTYIVNYNANGDTGGTAPSDSYHYETGETVTVLNKGDLVKTGHTFAGWNTKADGTGTVQAVGSTFNMGSENVTLYAQWTINTYTVTYNGNGNTGGTVPAGPTSYTYGTTVTVLGNTGALVKTGYTFSDWNTWSNGNGTDRAAGSTFVLGASNVILYAKWTTYSLRDEGPAGGLIFYINPNYLTDGWRYLEAAPSSTEWSGIQWGSYPELIGGTETGIGTGENNTNIIVTWLNDHFEYNRAAEYCFDLSIVNNSKTYDDWFLPSKDELNEMRVYLYGWGVGGFSLDYYWSSSEDNALNAWYQRFWNGWQSIYSKTNTLLVRAVRAF